MEGYGWDSQVEGGIDGTVRWKGVLMEQSDGRVCGWESDGRGYGWNSQMDRWRIMGETSRGVCCARDGGWGR